MAKETAVEKNTQFNNFIKFLTGKAGPLHGIDESKRNRLGGLDLEDGDFSSADRNKVLEVLFNKLASSSMYGSGRFTNKYSSFIKGKLKVGEYKEKLFIVNAAKPDNYETAEGENRLHKKDVANDLLRYRESKVLVEYSGNSKQDRVVISIAQGELEKALFSVNQFSTFVSAKMDELHNAITLEEEDLIKKMLVNSPATYNEKVVGGVSSNNITKFFASLINVKQELEIPKRSAKYNYQDVATKLHTGEFILLVNRKLEAPLMELYAQTYNPQFLQEKFNISEVVFEDFGDIQGIDEMNTWGYLIDPRHVEVDVYPNDGRITSQTVESLLYENIFYHTDKNYSWTGFFPAIRFTAQTALTAGLVQKKDEVEA